MFFNEAELSCKLLHARLEISHNWSVSYLFMHLETEQFVPEMTLSSVTEDTVIAKKCFD